MPTAQPSLSLVPDPVRPEPDQVHALSAPEQMLLWSIRRWVIDRRMGHDPDQSVRSLFERLGAPEAAPALDRLLWVLSHGITRMVEVNCTCCDTVCEDERLLLDLVTLHQEGRPEDADCLLGEIAGERTVQLASDCLQRLALPLQAAGLTLDPGGHCLRRNAFRAHHAGASGAIN